MTDQNEATTDPAPVYAAVRPCFICGRMIDTTVERGWQGISRIAEGSEKDPKLGEPFILTVCWSREHPCSNRLLERLLGSSGRGITLTEALVAEQSRSITRLNAALEHEKSVNERLLAIVERLSDTE